MAVSIGQTGHRILTSWRLKDPFRWHAFCLYIMIYFEQACLLCMEQKEETMKYQENLFDEMVQFRRWMHQHPELSESEKETADKIHDMLSLHGIEHQCNVGGYGISAIVRGSKPGPTVAAKTDIDALPVTEKWPKRFCISQYRGYARMRS